MTTKETEASSTTKPESAGLLARFFGIVFSPAETMAGVVAVPRWLGMLALTSVITAVFAGGFMATEVGQEAWFDEGLATTQAFGIEMREEQAERMVAMMPYLGITTVVNSLAGLPAFRLLFAGLLFLVFTVMLGATASFRQVFSVVVHSGVIMALAQVFIWPLNYFRQEMMSPTAIAVFLPMLDEGTFLFHVLNFIDLFRIWAIIVLSIGLSILYRRNAKSITLTLLVVYLLVAIGVGAIRGSLSG